jgi:diguanylate cyclase (GGDEF)-like protein/PAS domain S-box-containing protein
VTELGRHADPFVRALVRGSNGLVYLLDRAGRYVGWHGVDGRRLEGRKIGDVLDPDQAEFVMDALARAFASDDGVGYRYESSVDGVTYTYDCRMERVDADHVVCMVRDLTEQVEDNRAYLKSAARFRAIVQGSSELVVVTDGEGAITYVSDAPARRLGHDPGALIGRNAFELIHPDEAPDAIEALTGSLAGAGVKETAEVRIRTADGGWRLFEVVPTNMLDDPDVEGLVFHLRDLTERYEQQRAFRFMFEYSPLPQIQSFPERPGIVANHAFVRLTGYSREELITRGVRDLVHPEDRGEIETISKQLLHGVPHVTSQLRFVRKDGTVFHGRVQATTVRDDAGSLSYVLGAFEDVTAEIEATIERRRAERAQREAEERFRTTFEHSPLCVSLVDLDGHILDINAAGAALFQRSRGSLIGTDARRFVHRDDLAHAIEMTRQQIAGIDAVAEFRMVPSDGSEVWVMSRSTLVTPDEDGTPYVITLQADITARRHLEDRLAREATTDHLTGLLNRNAFMSHVQVALAGNGRTSVGLLFVDLDRFKEVNDTCGHDVGDEVLIAVARAIERVTRSGDVVARLGGDEFVVLMHGVDSTTVAAVGGRVVDAVCEPIAVGSRLIQVGASVGGALATEVDEVTALIRRADTAAYRAKRQGGSVTVLSDVAG